MSTMSTYEDDIYTAGLMDGEGSVSLTPHKRNQRPSPRASVASTTTELIEFLNQTYGGWVCKKKVYQAHHKDSWTWYVTGDSALVFLEKVLPYMKEPVKLQRANLLCSSYKSVTKRNGKYSSEDLLKKIQFEDTFKSFK